VEYDIEEDNTPEDVVEYTNILGEFWDVFAWNMAEMTTIKDEQFKIPITDPASVLRQQYILVMLDVLVRSHISAAMAESWMPSQICLQFEGAALQIRSFLSCENCVADWEFE
jgi:hypothetical protein